ncbi:hypothetical protein BJX64DRAFT_297802 [Aspergillus heterothallicus]
MSKPRKTHKKSRYGCDTCRRRRVKCDELGPPCTNCILRQLPNCTYSRILPASLLANARRRASHDASRIPSPSSSPRPCSSLNPNGIDELELMHHFATETYATLCVSTSESRTWQVLVPRLALKHRYLMHGILSLAALHIAAVRDPPGETARPYVDAGLEYHSRSLEPFRIAVGDLSAENAEAAFAQAVVTTAISLAVPQVTGGGGARKQEEEGEGEEKEEEEVVGGSGAAGPPRMTDHILTIFELLQGVKKILTLGKPYISLQLFSQGSFWRKDSPGILDVETDDAFARLSALNESTTAPLHPEQARVNAEVINYLRHCFAKFACAPEPDPAPVLAWLGAVDLGFVESVRRRESASLLVLSYWGILLMSLDGNRWWARGAGRALMKELMEDLGGEELGYEWEGCLGWVRKTDNQGSKYYKNIDVNSIGIQTTQMTGQIAAQSVIRILPPRGLR